ncbi:MAG: hypothetical protein ACREUT_15540 [Steroidobacteraceae bacterium]
MNAHAQTSRERPHLRMFGGIWVCGLRYGSGFSPPIGVGKTQLGAMIAWRFKFADPHERAFPVPSVRRASYALAQLQLPVNALIREYARDRILERYPCLS